MFYTYEIDGIDYEDNMHRDPDALARFYEDISNGKTARTTQINYARYYDYFENLLKDGDILHINFSSGMTNSIHNAMQAAEDLQKEHPERKIRIVDSLSASVGYGLLTEYAADLRDAGMSMDELGDWLEANALRFRHQYYSTQLDHYKRSGRLTGATAMIATVLNICPLMDMNELGQIVAYDKTRGKKKALEFTLQCMEDTAENGVNYDGKCFINHSACLPEAELARTAVLERFPKLREENVRIYEIGNVIGAHTGPGTVGLYFFGEPRKHRED